MGSQFRSLPGAPERTRAMTCCQYGSGMMSRAYDLWCLCRRTCPASSRTGWYRTTWRQFASFFDVLLLKQICRLRFVWMRRQVHGGIHSVVLWRHQQRLRGQGAVRAHRRGGSCSRCHREGSPRCEQLRRPAPRGQRPDRWLRGNDPPLSGGEEAGHRELQETATVVVDPL